MKASEFITEKKDACYNKVRSRYKVWPSAYASGALVQCRKKGAKNWGNKSKNEDINEEQLEEGFKEKAAALIMSLGLLGPVAAQNQQNFDLNDVARALPMVVDVINQTRGMENKDILRRVISKQINTYRAQESQFDNWFAGQLHDPRDKAAFRLAVRYKVQYQSRAMNMRSGEDAAKAAAAVAYYEEVKHNLAQKYSIQLPQ